MLTIGIIAAMEEEIEHLIEKMENKIENIKFNMCFYTGELMKRKVIIVKSGIGKVNAAMCTTILIECFKPDIIINVGVAGGLFKELCPGDVVIGSDLIQYDVDATCFGYKIGQVPKLNQRFLCDEKLIEKALISAKSLKNIKYVKGTIVTGDKFINSKKDVEFLVNEFNGYACEMEGASIAQVCSISNVPFVIIRSISDNGNTGAKIDYEKFKKIAIENSMVIIEEFFKII